MDALVLLGQQGARSGGRLGNRVCVFGGEMSQINLPKTLEQVL